MNTPDSQTRLTEQLIYETRQTVAWGQDVHRTFQEVATELREFIQGRKQEQRPSRTRGPCRQMSSPNRARKEVG
jgi:hypothetical protein